MRVLFPAVRLAGANDAEMKTGHVIGDLVVNDVHTLRPRVGLAGFDLPGSG